MKDYNYRFDGIPSMELIKDTVTKHFMDNCPFSINIQYVGSGGKMEIRSLDFVVAMVVKINGVVILMIKSMDIITELVRYGRRAAINEQKRREVMERSGRTSTGNYQWSPVDNEPYSAKCGEYASRNKKVERGDHKPSKVKAIFFTLSDIEDAVLITAEEVYSSVDLAEKGNDHATIRMFSGGRGSGKTSKMKRVAELIILDDLEKEAYPTRGAAEFAAKTSGHNVDYTINQHRVSEDDDAMWWFTIDYNKKTMRDNVKVWYDEAVTSYNSDDMIVETGGITIKENKIASFLKSMYGMVVKIKREA